MANYSIVSNAKFRPFSYQELLAPVLAATQAHQALEDSYSALGMSSEEWGNKLNAQIDKESYAKYQAYTNALEKEAEELSKYGLTPSSRQSMLNMRTRYAKDINPIAEAWKRREEQIAEQRKAGNAMISDFDAQTTSIDEYVRNPSLAYKYIDRKDLYTRAVNDFSQYAKALSDYGNGKRLDSFTKTFIQSTGITPEQARDFTSAIRSGNIDTSNPTLREVYKALYNSTGVDRWNNADAQRAVQETILEGVGAAIGKSTVSPYADKAAEYAQQLANQKALINYQGEQAAKERAKMYDISPTTYYSASEVAKANGEIAKQLDEFRDKGYFDANGNITKEGLDALKVEYQNIKSDAYGTSFGTRIVAGDADFKKWYDAAIRSPYARGSHGVSAASNYYRNIRKAIENGELATGTANFNVYRQRLTGQDRNVAADNILAALGADGKIIKAGGLDNQGNITGTEVSKKKFMEALGRDESGKGNSTIHYIMNSPTTGKDGQQLIELTNGEKYILPAGILGIDTQANLGRANLNVRNSDSSAEVATNLNLSNFYLASMLTTTGGTEIKPNDGTVTIDLNQ